MSSCNSTSRGQQGIASSSAITGTGKSHLMSVVSAVAEHGELAEKIRHPAVREKAREIGGKFRVIRTENRLDDDVLRQLCRR